MGVFQRLNKSVLYYLETLMLNLHTDCEPALTILYLQGHYIFLCIEYVEQKINIRNKPQMCCLYMLLLSI